MIAIGLIGVCIFSFISLGIRILDEAGRKIPDYIWWAVGIILFGSFGLISIGLAVLAWRTLP